MKLGSMIVQSLAARGEVALPDNGFRPRTVHPRAKRQLRICREGMIYMAVCSVVLLGSILRDVNLLLVLACMMIGPFLLNGAVAMMMLGSVRISRDVPRRIVSHAAWNVAYRIDNTTARSPAWTMVFNDTICRWNGPIAAHVESFVLHVGRGVTAVTTFAAPPLPRGRYVLDTLTVTTRFPFGLVSVSSVTNHPKEFVVVPRIGFLEANWVTWLRRAQHQGCRGGSRHGRSDGEFHAMRDWRAGDPRKWIHWRTTARRNALTVRELESPDSKDLVVLVDLCTETAAVANLDSDVERMISFVATLVARHCMKSGTAILVGIAGREDTILQGVASQRFQDEVLSQLAVVEASAGSSLSRMIPKIIGRVSRDALVLLVGRQPAVASSPREAQLMARCTFVPVVSAEFRTIFVMPDAAPPDAAPMGPVNAK